MRNTRAPTTLEVGDSATDPSVIGYRLPRANLPKNRSRGALGLRQHEGPFDQIGLVQHTFGTGLGLVGSNRYEAINV